jgi:Sec-independent protein translocase protein TatA
MNGGQMMIVMIIAIVMVARVLRTRGGGLDFRGAGRRFRGAAPDQEDEAENRRLREEVRALKERIAVLERIATDSPGPTHLEREIEALRDRPSSRERL